MRFSESPYLAIIQYIGSSSVEDYGGSYDD
jgi:hypothetical protein